MKTGEETEETQEGRGPELTGWSPTETAGEVAPFPLFSPFVALSEFVGSTSASDPRPMAP